MNPVLERSDRLALFLIAWGVLGSGLTFLFVGQAGVAWQTVVWLTVPHAVLMGFISLSAWYVCRSTPLRKTGIGSAALTLASAAILASAFWFVLGLGLAAALARVGGGPSLFDLYWNGGVIVLEAGVLLYALSLAVSYLAIGLHESREAERQVLNAQVLAREAELRALRSQIDPHFLFNALNSVSALTTADPPGARRMCVMLSDFLRQGSRMRNHNLIALSEELALVQQYLDIEKVRFGARLAVTLETAPAAAPCLVPPLLLQPLVENAVTHGIANLIEGGTIRVSASAADGQVVIMVENPRDPECRRPQTGFGLQNVRRRLDAHFGTRARLDVKDTGDSYAARVIVPCHGAGDVDPGGDQS